MKKEYMKPAVLVVELRHRTMLLAGSNSDVIPPGEPNKPAAALGFDGIDWGDWVE